MTVLHAAPDSKGSGCSATVCDGCPLTLFAIQPFSISDLNVHPGSNVTMSYSATPGEFTRKPLVLGA